MPRLVYFSVEEGNNLEGELLTCDGSHGIHADEENRELCKEQLKSFCVNVPAHGLHEEL
jgi:hypothetical protein